MRGDVVPARAHCRPPRKRRVTTLRVKGVTGDRQSGYWAKFQGMRSSTCDMGCMSMIRRSVTVRYVCGLTPLSLQVPSSEAHRAQVLAPSSLPANSAFFRVNGIGRIAFSTGLVSISTRPSSRKRVRPFHRLRAYRMCLAGSVAKSGWLVTCLRDLERGVEA